MNAAKSDSIVNVCFEMFQARIVRTEQIEPVRRNPDNSPNLKVDANGNGYYALGNRRAQPAKAGCAAAAARPPRRRDRGLSTSHIRPHRRGDLWAVRGYKGAGLIEVHSPGVRPGRSGGGKRGVVKRFSEAARRRLLRALSKVVREQLPVFVTLTYPDNFPGNPRVWKDQLKAWFKRLKRQHPQAAGFWKLELEPRKSGINAGTIAPHFHLLLWGLPEEWHDSQGYRLHWEFELQREKLIGNKSLRCWKEERFRDGQWDSTTVVNGVDPAAGYEVVTFTSERVNKRGESICVVEYYLRDGGKDFQNALNLICKDRGPAGTVQLHAWISLTWAEVVGSDDPRHVRAGTRVEKIRSREGVMFYASKYVSKLDTEAATGAGRFWGIHNVRAIPWGEVVDLPINGDEAVRLMRVAKRYIWAGQRRREHPRKIHWRPNCGMTFMCDASCWLERLPGLVGG